MKRVFLIMIGLSCIINAEFIRDDVREVVTDTSRGLMWQDNNATFQLKWKNAIKYCENLELPQGGYIDWRLPNINELGTLVDYTKKDPAISSKFKNTLSEKYWSSTTVSYSYHLNDAFVINFFLGIQWFESSKEDGISFLNGSGFSIYTRCVRDVQ